MSLRVLGEGVDEGLDAPIRAKVGCERVLGPAERIGQGDPSDAAAGPKARRM